MADQYRWIGSQGKFDYCAFKYSDNCDRFPSYIKEFTIDLLLWKMKENIPYCEYHMKKEWATDKNQ